MPPETLFRYLIGRTVYAVAALFVTLATLIFLIDLLENMRFAGKFADASLVFALKVTALRTPSLAQALAPFIFLFGSIWMFTQLNRRSEVSVMRSAGLSVWKLVGPPALVAAVFGVLTVFLIDPVSATMYAASDRYKDDVRGKTSSLLRVLSDGIWLRQRAPNSVLLINAKTFDASRGALSGVTIWRLGADATFLERIDASAAILRNQTIELYDARLKTEEDRLDHRTPVYAIRTTLTAKDFTERVTSAETLSVWRLPHVTALAEAAGLPTVRYHLRFHDLCATPLKLIAMVLIAAVFSLRPWRGGGAFRLALGSIGAGFALYVLTELFIALGEAGVAPVALSAWMPAVVATLAAAAMLLQFEDG